MNTPETFPSWATTLLATDPNVAPPFESLTGCYETMSLGNLKIVGDVYRYVPPNPSVSIALNSLIFGSEHVYGLWVFALPVFRLKLT
jgi:hypothetical protein